MGTGDPIEGLDAAQRAAVELLRPRMAERADAVCAEFFARASEYVDEDLGPLLATAGLDSWATKIAFVRMVAQRQVAHAFTETWGHKTQRERLQAVDFLTVFLGHLGNAIGRVAEERCVIFVGWGDAPASGGPKVVTPGNNGGLYG